MMYTVVALCFTLYTTSTVGSVVDTAKQNGCSKLATLITDAGLKQALDSANSVTLFAPSDAAVDAIPAEIVKQLTNNKTLLQEVLKYHVVSGIKASSDIKNDELLPTLFGKSMLRTNIYKYGQVVTAEGSTVSKADLKASNGLVHVIDKVIYPIPAVTTPIFLTFDKNLNNMGYLVFRGELIEKLSAQSFTVFAPVNTAIEKIPGQDYNDLLMNKTALDGFVNTHVIQGTVYSSALSEGMPVTVTTLQGFKLIIKVTSGGVTVNGANVTKADISTTNGVIHVIDDILVTPKFPPHDVPFIG